MTQNLIQNFFLGIREFKIAVAKGTFPDTQEQGPKSEKVFWGKVKQRENG